jgi:serine protease Do
MMKRFPRPFPKLVLLTLPGICLALAPAGMAAQRITLDTFGPHAPLLLAHPAQGYLGVDVRDVSSDRAAALKLKDQHGAEIVTVDHDAPAGKAGLRIHDVIMQMNGQAVDGEAQFSRMLHETPPGRTVALLISRDGQTQTISIVLGDRAKIEADAWPQPVPLSEEDDGASAPAAASSTAGTEEASAGSSSTPVTGGKGFFGTFRLDPLYVGLELEPVGTQLADYFGVHDGTGLLVQRVEDNSPASAAGLKAGDVITRVNGKEMATHSQWMKALRENRGKQIQVTIVRSRREETLTMTAGQSKKSSLELPGFGHSTSPVLRD